MLREEPWGFRRIGASFSSPFWGERPRKALGLAPCPPLQSAAFCSMLKGNIPNHQRRDGTMAYGSVKMCLQCATCSMVSTCLFRALRFLSYRDSRVQKEACQWPKGKTLRLEIPGARGFTVTGTEHGFRKLPQDTPGDVTIRFKSPADASGSSPGRSASPRPMPSTGSPAGEHGPGHALRAMRGHRGGVPLPLVPGQAHLETTTKKGSIHRPGLPGGAVWEVMPHVCLL